jgi:flagellar protein FlbD
MINVTCLDGRHALVNADQIETIEQTPDTIISFMSGHKLLVRDAPEDLALRVVEYRRAIARDARGPRSPFGGPTPLAGRGGGA